ncbi:GTP-binding protein, Ras family protein [Entamoeba nuttalli P19]|uniref:GTP-binding protein, Ras family protein n=1 Tax=Entamoeba nuttalli (strain P19) TaxID=1076696 RepID=K2HA26_ENTNP|nr:GTP-binding protein, Ras family protein [Entamoeba nuttalli P19]EKE39444.1 GTP-binding protein, Ras family protein [Entamoeba nuttalli P19]|eukprot:XP_008858220.1 GTP-binding protein, Ras family protein [Entamoeba nuttalli P19]
MNYPKALKILVVGGDKTFKSTLCKVLVGNTFSSSYIHTVGINIYRSSVNDRSVIYWDIPFSEYKLGRNLALIKEHVDGIILMTNKDIESSFDAARDWMTLFAKIATHILVVKDYKEDLDLSMRYEELKKIHQNINNVYFKPMLVHKKKGVFEAVNDFIEKILHQFKDTEICLTEESDTSSSSPTPSVKYTPSPKFFTFSPSSLTSNSNGKIITKNFITQTKKEVITLYDDINEYINQLESSSFDNSVDDFYKKRELNRFHSHVDIEKKELLKELESYEVLLEKNKNGVNVTCDDVQKLLIIREHCWQKNFEFIGYNYIVKKPKN